MSVAELRVLKVCFTRMLLSVGAIPSAFLLILEEMAVVEARAAEVMVLFKLRVECLEFRVASLRGTKQSRYSLEFRV